MIQAAKALPVAAAKAAPAFPNLGPDAGMLASFLLPEVARPFVARIAAEGASPSDLPVLLRFAPAHPDPDIHRMVLGVLARILPKEQVRPFFHSLYALAGPGRKARRERVREVLAALDPGELTALWAESDQPERLDLLDRLATRRTAAAFVEAIRKLSLLCCDDEFVRARVARLLGRLRLPGVRPILEGMLRDPDARVVANTVESLIPCFESPEAARRVLGPLVNHRSARVRANTLVGLIATGNREAKERLADMLGAEAIPAKASARWALNQLPKTGKQRAVQVA